MHLSKDLVYLQQLQFICQAPLFLRQELEKVAEVLQQDGQDNESNFVEKGFL